VKLRGEKKEKTNQTNVNDKQFTMYITGILQYLIWPAFIVLCWYAVRYAVITYERKFPGE
jgi:hypothetical protein